MDLGGRLSAFMANALYFLSLLAFILASPPNDKSFFFFFPPTKLLVKLSKQRNLHFYFTWNTFILFCESNIHSSDPVCKHCLVAVGSSPAVQEVMSFYIYREALCSLQKQCANYTGHKVQIDHFKLLENTSILKQGNTPLPSFSMAFSLITVEVKLKSISDANSFQSAEWTGGYIGMLKLSAVALYRKASVP